MARRALAVLPLLLWLLLPTCGQAAEEPSAEKYRVSIPRARLDVKRLQSMRDSVQALERQRQPLEPLGGYQDFRTVIHCHTRFSHDSRGTEAEITEAAKRAGVRAIFMTDHYAADRKFLKQGPRGFNDGVLFIPGTEISSGLLAFRLDGVPFDPDQEYQKLINTLAAAKCPVFIAHPEKRPNWNLTGFSGMEIYNVHADAMDGNGEGDGAALPKTAADVRRLGEVWLLLLDYPQEVFAAIFDPPAANLKAWDTLGARRRVAGFAANDAHQNVGVTGFLEPGRMVRLEDALGSTLLKVDLSKIPELGLFALGRRPGDTIFRAYLDPYRINFRYVSTHLLAKSLTESALVDALTQGRGYVAFDWMGDPTGFAFSAEGGASPLLMGQEAPWSAEMRISAASPLPCRFRLLLNGEEVRRTEGRSMVHTASRPGVYRVEADLLIAKEWRPWVYTNPIYLR